MQTRHCIGRGAVVAIVQRPYPLDARGDDSGIVRMRAAVHGLAVTGSGGLIGGEEDEVAGAVLDMETGQMQPDQKTPDLRPPPDRDRDQMVVLIGGWRRWYGHPLTRLAGRRAQLDGDVGDGLVIDTLADHQLLPLVDPRNGHRSRQSIMHECIDSQSGSAP